MASKPVSRKVVAAAGIGVPVATVLIYGFEEVVGKDLPMYVEAAIEMIAVFIAGYFKSEPEA